jgi:hypothetical protein
MLGREADMKWLSKLFVRQVKPELKPPEHAVIVSFRYGSTDLQPLHELEHDLERAISAAGVGEYDGNEIAVDGSDGSLYMYGPDADLLFQAVEPILRGCPWLREGSTLLRYGPPNEGTPQRTVPLNR